MPEMIIYENLYPYLSLNHNGIISLKGSQKSEVRSQKSEARSQNREE